MLLEFFPKNAFSQPSHPHTEHYFETKFESNTRHKKLSTEGISINTKYLRRNQKSFQLFFKTQKNHWAFQIMKVQENVNKKNACEWNSPPASF
jgi:hypothetical protein